MTWHRYFCSLCGAMTTRPPEPGEYTRCAAHAHLPNERDLIPPDPRETIPTMAAEAAREISPDDPEALRVLAMYGVLEVVQDDPDPAKVIYRMPDPEGVRRALDELEEAARERGT